MYNYNCNYNYNITSQREDRRIIDNTTQDSYHHEFHL